LEDPKIDLSAKYGFNPRIELWKKILQFQVINNSSHIMKKYQRFKYHY
jgi:hypothetical protein